MQASLGTCRASKVGIRAHQFTLSAGGCMGIEEDVALRGGGQNPCLLASVVFQLEWSLEQVSFLYRLLEKSLGREEGMHFVVAGISVCHQCR